MSRSPCACVCCRCIGTSENNGCFSKQNNGESKNRPKKSTNRNQYAERPLGACAIFGVIAELFVTCNEARCLFFSQIGMDDANGMPVRFRMSTFRRLFGDRLIALTRSTHTTHTHTNTYTLYIYLLFNVDNIARHSLTTAVLGDAFEKYQAIYSENCTIAHMNKKTQTKNINIASSRKHFELGNSMIHFCMNRQLLHRNIFHTSK